MPCMFALESVDVAAHSPGPVRFRLAPRSGRQKVVLTLMPNVRGRIVVASDSPLERLKAI